MKLLNKFTLWYLAITTVVLLAGGLIVFYLVQHEIDKEAKNRLKNQINVIAEQLKNGVPADQLNKEQIIIKELEPASPLIAPFSTDTMGIFAPARGPDRKLTLSSSFKINGAHYLISAYDFIAEPDEITTGVIISLSWVFLILLLFVALFSRLMSKKILSPFNKTLYAIKSFNLKQQSNIILPDTKTHEFRQLNQFLEKMSVKALDDYRSLKEFTENASHELQTPLAIIRGKLELLMESEITNEQAKLILAAHEAVDKLSRINQSLTFLTKLENKEYEVQSNVNLSQLTLNAVESFEELIQMKSIKVTRDIEKDVILRLNPALADILLTNILSNAIRHNYTNGAIHVTLTKEKLSIQNSGATPQVPVHELFQRFKKSNQSGDSIGLGLSIVKQICEHNAYGVDYRYENHLHIVEINFNKKR
jgi:signal transduction histidine kinase